MNIGEERKQALKRFRLYQVGSIALYSAAVFIGLSNSSLLALTIVFAVLAADVSIGGLICAIAYNFALELEERGAKE